ncbi:Ribosome-associated translation inhibitor RaiA (RaiA) (PDB:1IMU) [Commensalibacter communis]|uniref:Ribosome hibernation promoting factor n=1 Tax=Commensalibacter communis TaxID=2972786 RepID=A0A9W4TPI8_9PROT|nr:ribosome-associated translation inhibitor RaiA [Commensalibacter communis]CAI3924055.1 Ribosome-associated translation inhibitor RaiA (RaiA) (PDB:1IMU) [Commensalibacter communis]CAI3924573.1 Ribosome-associated translation inhibitor RaiA (RaiA) (PDB:1IMU) [Commensalibacter communis]CAI3946075.1 Ribosome-associated translation inhibitor RaiA (RaiA) (PDB:1IMU) [Commensalibacter communis]CAI3946320.1 Ribosome-associated translation inhibitor RaiA (RaiA) (PDB:1IMU) [Commensalibacter communis]
MKISIFGKKIEIPEWFREKIEDTIEKTTQKYFDNIIDVSVTFNKLPSSYTCQIHVHASRDLSIRSEGTATEVQAAFESAIQHITKRLRRYKSRLLSRRGEKAAYNQFVEGRQYIIRPDQDVEEQESTHQEQLEQAIKERIITEKATEIDNLTVYEAIMHLDLSERPVLMFKNSENNRINVVYRHIDGQVIWLDSGINQ